MPRATRQVLEARRQAFNNLVAQGLTAGSTCAYRGQGEPMTVLFVAPGEDFVLQVQDVGAGYRLAAFNADPRDLTLISVWPVEALELLLSLTVTSGELQAFLQRVAPTGEVAEKFVEQLQKKLDERVAQEQSLVVE